MFFKGRSIVVDWAIPKNKYETIHSSNPKENKESDLVKIKEDVEIKEEFKEEILSDDQDDIEEPSKTIEDYLSLDTKNEDDNFVDFETTELE